MFKRVTSLGVVALLSLPMHACSSGGDDDQFTFGSSFTGQTTYTTTGATLSTTASETSGDGDGEPGDGDGEPTTTGDGDGAPTTTTTGDGDGDGDPNCPPGDFGCPCNNGTCGPGLECDFNTNTCDMAPDPTTTSTSSTTTGNGNDPWDPDTCTPPAQEVTVTDITGALCSAPCVVDADCPAGPVGTTPACALVVDMNPDPTQCALLCNPAQDTCSPGSTCKQVPNQPGLGLCTYP